MTITRGYSMQHFVPAYIAADTGCGVRDAEQRALRCAIEWAQLALDAECPMVRMYSRPSDIGGVPVLSYTVEYSTESDTHATFS